jgi:hypothetical protein
MTRMRGLPRSSRRSPVRAQPSRPGLPSLRLVPPSGIHVQRRRRAAAWQGVLIYGALVSVVGTGPASAQLSPPDRAVPAAESDAAECSKREAIAAAIAKLDTARATGTPFEELLRQLADIERRIVELQPATGRTCPDDLDIVGLSERFDPIRQDLASEHRRREISRKSWPEHVKRAVLEKRIEIGMTREQVTAAWGEPRNVDITPITRQEQWTYSGPIYLYFTDGAVATIARTRRPRD